VIESRIREIDDKLSRASVIDVSGIDCDVVKFGCTVKVEEHASGTISEFKIVGSDEADVEAGLIPITSPIAKALIGKTVGSDVDVSTPSGIKGYTILSLCYV
jgi:transcription elongation factor GreA